MYPLSLECCLHYPKCQLRRCIAAHEYIGSGKSRLGPGVDRDVGLGQQQHACHAHRFAEAVEVAVQDAGAGGQRACAQEGVDLGRIGQQLGRHAVEVG